MRSASSARPSSTTRSASASSQAFLVRVGSGSAAAAPEPAVQESADHIAGTIAVLFTRRAGLVRIVHNDALAPQRVVERPSLDHGDAPHTEFLLQHQLLGDDEPLLIDGDDELAVLVPRCDLGADDLVDRDVLELDLFAPPFDLEAGGDLLHFGTDDERAQLARLDSRDEV